jgi:hypothetical protein
LMEVPNRFIRFSRSPNLIKTRTAPLILAIAFYHRYFCLSVLPALSSRLNGSRSSSEAYTSDAFESPLEYGVSGISSSSTWSLSMLMIKHRQKYLTHHFSFCSLI